MLLQGVKNRAEFRVKQEVFDLSGPTQETLHGLIQENECIGLKRDVMPCGVVEAFFPLTGSRGSVYCDFVFCAWLVQRGGGDIFGK